MTHRWFATSLLLEPHESPESAATLEEHLRLRTLVLSRAIALGLAICAVLWWPLDRLLPFSPEDLAQLSKFRLQGAAASAFYFLVLRCVGWGKQRPGVVLLAMICHLGGGVALLLADVGTPERPLLYSLYVVAFASLAYVGPLGPRIAATVAANVVTLALLVQSHPQLLGEPLFMNFAIVLGFACACSVFAGHLAYLPTRESFLRGLALKEANEELERRVRERTAELRRLSAHLTGLLESERTRLARELHDELAQSLSTLRFEVDLLATAPSGAGTQEPLRRMESLLDATLATVRRILAGLRPRILDDLGIAAGLDWLVQEFRRRHPGVVCTLDVGLGDEEVSATHSTAIFRIVQECLSNVSRHAAARQVRVSIARGPEGFRLEVGDDGAGIPEGRRRPDAMGLLGLRERAWQLGGTIDIASKPGEGTRIHVLLPHTAPAEAA